MIEPQPQPRLPIKSTPERMHSLYCTLTGLQIQFSMQRLYAWELFCLKFSEQDLRDLVKHIKSKGARGRSLIFRSLISGPGAVEFAEEDLAEYRAMSRTKPMTPRDEVLRASGRVAESEPAKSAGALVPKTVEEMKAFFAKCKAEAGL